MSNYDIFKVSLIKQNFDKSYKDILREMKKSKPNAYLVTLKLYGLPYDDFTRNMLKIHIEANEFYEHFATNVRYYLKLSKNYTESLDTIDI